MASSPGLITRVCRFDRSFDALAAIFDFVAEFYVAAGRAEADHSMVDLIIEELFTNMVKYNPTGPEPIEISLRRVPQGVEIVIVDPVAPLFDVTAVAPVDTEAYVAEQRVGGLGLHLVRQFADAIHYEHRNGGSRITVLKNMEG